MKNITYFTELFRAIFLSGKSSIHTMELNETIRKDHNDARRSELNNVDLKADLVKQYGKTKWATKLIKEIIDKITWRRTE